MHDCIATSTSISKYEHGQRWSAQPNKPSCQLHFLFKLKEYSLILKTSFYDKNQKIETKKSLFPKFQLIPILRFQVMHDYVCFIAPIDHCVE